MRVAIAAFTAAASSLLAAASESAAADYVGSTVTAIRVKPGSFTVLLDLPSLAGGTKATGTQISAAIDSLAAISGVEVKNSLPDLGLVLVTAPHDSAARIRTAAPVKAVAPTLIFYTPSVGIRRDLHFTSLNDTDAQFVVDREMSVVNEPDFRRLQWGRTAIKADRAFNAGVKGGGKRPARVAIVDGGFWLDHPSIKHYNKKLSFNFVAGEKLNFNTKIGNDPTTGSFDFSHGTHTASIMGGADLGTSGTLGVAPKAELILLKVLSDSGHGDDWPVISAIKYAADNNVDILSLSLGDKFDRRGVKGKYTAEDVAAIIQIYSSLTKYAAARKTSIIAAAGNSATNMDKDKPYFFWLLADLPHVIPVSATGPTFWGRNRKTDLDEFAYYSNSGSQIDFAAPGGSLKVANTKPDATCTVRVDASFIIKDFPCRRLDYVISACCSKKALFTKAQYGYKSRYAWISGTSMAAPHVAGVAALIVAKRGKPTSPAQLLKYLKQCSDDLGAKGKDDLFGFGRINAGKVVDLKF